MGEIKREATRAASSKWARWLARAGLVAKGISFGIVAALAFQVAFGDHGKLEDRPGALQSIAETTLGRFLLGALAVGLGGYAVWRFAEALLGRTLEAKDKLGFFKRVGVVARGLLYAWLCLVCATLVLQADEPVTGGSGGSGSRDEDWATRVVLEQPVGRYIVLAIGLAIIGAGLFNLYRALSGDFRDELKEEQMGRQERRWYTVLGVLGHLARAVIFSLAGIFLVRAAWDYDPDEAIGLDGALRKLARAEYGDFLLVGTAAGLMAYGLFCLVQARYREV